MTAVTVPVVQIWDQAKTPGNTALVGVTVRVTLNFNQATYSNPVVALPPVTVSTTTDSNGYWTVSVAANDLINPSGTTYTVHVAGYNPYDISVLSTNVPVGGWQSSAIVVNAPSALGVTGAQLPSPVTATGILNVTGALNANSTLAVAGTLDANGILNANSTLNVTGVLNANGIVNANTTLNANSILNVTGNARFHGPDPWFDVTEPTFGAKGDGATDDTAAIQAALTAARTNGGATVFVPFGTTGVYLVSLVAHPTAANYFACLVPGANTTLVLAPGVTIKLAPNQTHGNDVAGSNWMLVNYQITGGDENMAVIGGTFDGNAANQTHTHNGLGWFKARNCTRTDVIVQNCRGTATSGVNETFFYEFNSSSGCRDTRCGARGTDTLVYNDGSATGTSATFTSQAATFAASDVGKAITILGAGASNIAKLTTTISGFTDAHTITLAATAGTTITGKARFLYGTRTASGFASDDSINVVREGCWAWGLSVANGFTDFGGAGIRNDKCWSVLSALNGFNVETCDDLDLDACMAGGIASVDNPIQSFSTQSFAASGSGAGVSYAATTLTDTGATWQPNQWAGGEVVVAGDRQVIASNTDTVATLLDQWRSTPANTTAYVVGGNLGNLATGINLSGDTAGAKQRIRVTGGSARGNKQNLNIQLQAGARVIGLEASDAVLGGGVNVQGSPDTELIGVVARRNALTGLIIQSSTVESTNVHIAGGDYSDNGTNTVGATGDGNLAGIYIANASAVRIDGARATDTKTTKTQTYGLAGVNTASIYAAHNDFTTSLTGSVNLATAVKANSQLRNNLGYNPAGTVTTPSFPATTVAATNATGVDVLAFVTAGVNAVTVQLDAVTALMIIPAAGVGMVMIPAGSTFTPTYAGGTPTWKWYGL